MFDMLKVKFEEAEARWKSDLEQAEAQRKKDAERAEAQRKKDQVDTKEQNRKYWSTGSSTLSSRPQNETWSGNKRIRLRSNILKA